MKNRSLSSNQDIENDQGPKPAHAHFCSSAFLNGDGSNAFRRSSVVKISAGGHRRDILTPEEHMKGAYQMLAGI